jgi:hypothetical protein
MQSNSAARTEINKANAQFSTGPNTAAGKAASALNAVKTGLTGRTVLLPSEDAAAYEQHVARYAAEFQPSGLRETELVQSLADTSWRLQRIPGLEAAIYARGRMEFASLVAFQPAEHRAAFLDLETHLRYEKQLRNLQIQEGRLARRYEKEMKELRQLQVERLAAAKAEALKVTAAKAEALKVTAAKAEGAKTPQPAAGFVFATAPVLTPAPQPSSTSHQN